MCHVHTIYSVLLGSVKGFDAICHLCLLFRFFSIDQSLYIVRSFVHRLYQTCAQTNIRFWFALYLNCSWRPKCFKWNQNWLTSRSRSYKVSTCEQYRNTQTIHSRCIHVKVKCMCSWQTNILFHQQKCFINCCSEMFHTVSNCFTDWDWQCFFLSLFLIGNWELAMIIAR